MILPAALFLTLVQAPAPTADLMYASIPGARAMGVDEGIRALALSGDPILATGILVTEESAPTEVAVRTGHSDAWGCVYGSRLCRHESAIVKDGSLYAPVSYVAYAGCGYSPTQAHAGRAICWPGHVWCLDYECGLTARQDGIAREFEETSVGLRAGRAITAARQREALAAARGSSSSPSGTSSRSSAYTAPSGGAVSAGASRSSSGSGSFSRGGSARGAKVQ